MDVRTTPAFAAPEQSSSVRVLLAEDNEVNVQLVSQILALRPSWRLKIACNGREAMQTIEHEHPDAFRDRE